MTDGRYKCLLCGEVHELEDHCPEAIEDRASLPVMDEPDNFSGFQGSPHIFCECPVCHMSVPEGAPCPHHAPNAPNAHGVPTGKTPFHLADLDFLAAMCDNYRDGITDGRSANGWKDMEWDDKRREEYTAKIIRHLHRYTQTGDPAHLAAVACNANIIWHHAQKEKKQ